MLDNFPVRALLIICLLLCQVDMQLLALPADTVTINEYTTSAVLDQQLVYGIDSSASKTIEEIIGQDAFFRSRNTGEKLKGGNIWAMIMLQNDSDDSVAYVAEVIGYKEVKVFVKEKDGVVTQIKRTGRYIPFPENELGNYKFRTNKVLLKLSGQQTYELYLFYSDPGIEKIEIGLHIAQEELWHFRENKIDKKKNLLLGLFFGVAIVLAFINLAYYFFLRDITYFAYFVYLITLVLFESSRYGFLDSTPVSQFPVFGLIAENCLLLLSVIAYLVFLKNFVGLKTRFPKWEKIIRFNILILVLGMLGVVAIMGVLEYPRVAVHLRNYFILFTLPFITSLLIFLLRKGNQVDTIFVIGSFVLLATGLTSIVLDLFFFDTMYPDVFFQAGTIVEITIFGIALGMKSRKSEQEKQEAQKNLIDQLKKNEQLQITVNQELEKQVHERTKEIQAQNEELVTQQEELAAHRDMLEGQNKIIARNMEELQKVKGQLEDIVESRTQELKVANQELVQHNNQLEQYAYITAHNLRAPVARLKGLMYIFEKTGGVTEEHKDIIEKISGSALEMDEVLTDINAILELKNSNYGPTQQVEITKIVDKSRKILAESLDECKAKINLNLEVTKVHAIEPYMESIFYNLISNAIKYQSADRRLQINISSYPDGANVILEVKDNGIGMDLDQSGSKLFGLYQRFHDHVGGKGLGLYLVKTQVEALGGSISVESEAGKGSTFRVAFPA
jgi:signal transduction histidine kinase